MGLALGGKAGASLCRQIGIVACGSPLLNQLKKLSLLVFKVPKILGVDDFAFRKGQRYGTILVDLELNQPLALLADRKAETLTDWLIQHPGVEILSREACATTSRSLKDIRKRDGQRGPSSHSSSRSISSGKKSGTNLRKMAAPDLPEVMATNGSSGRSRLEPYKQSLLANW